MDKQAQLLLDFVDLKGRMRINSSGCYSTQRTPALRYLLKHGYLIQYRELDGFGTVRHSYVKPAKPRHLTKIFCPCCKVDLTAWCAVWQTLGRGTSEYFSDAKHKYNCSMRIDHFYDRWDRKFPRQRRF